MIGVLVPGMALAHVIDPPLAALELPAAPPAPRPPALPHFDPANHTASQDLTYNAQHPARYPREAVMAHHEGRVLMLILVSEKGDIGEVRVEQSSGYLELDNAAVAAARTWRFSPGYRDGVPQASWVRVPATFALNWPPAGK